jgi:ABC-2 type transport system permease protein
VSGAVRAVGATELRKLRAQAPVRALAVACVAGPLALAGVLALQSAVPGDTLFGQWVHTSATALPLVVLSFASAWVFPVLGGLVGALVFGAEDRYDTWKTVLTRSRSRAELFAGKSVTALACAVALTAALAVSSVVAGLLLAGAHPIVGLSGNLVGPGHGLVLALASWALVLPPVAGFASVAILMAVVSRSALVGVVGPIVLGLVMQLLGLIGGGEIVRTLLLSSSFDAWHGLFAERPFHGPLLLGEAVAVVWIVVPLAIAAAVLRRRQFAGAHAERPAGRGVAVRRVALAAAVIALVAVGETLGPSPITPRRLDRSFAGAFNRLVTYQQVLLGRSVPAGTSLNAVPYCFRRSGGSAKRGPGDDWTCRMFAGAPGTSNAVQVDYEVTVRPNGCYDASSPPGYIGGLRIRDADGHSVLNPLFRIQGCLDTT